MSPLKKKAISRTIKEGRNSLGSIVLFAAGNEGLDYLNFYADVPDVIVVGASDSQDRYCSYSNRGKNLSVVAPSSGDWPSISARAAWDEGTTIRGEGAYRYWRDGKNRSSQHKHFGGTTNSVAMVGGVCALILSANPHLTVAEVKAVLEQTADKIGQPSDYQNGFSVKYGYGRINAEKAVTEAIRRRTEPSSKTDKTENSIISKSVFSFDKAEGSSGLYHFSQALEHIDSYGVHIGALAEYAKVLLEGEKLEQKFEMPVYVQISIINGKNVYKMIIGSYQKKEDATQLLEKIGQTGVKGFIRNYKNFR